MAVPFVPNTHNTYRHSASQSHPILFAVFTIKKIKTGLFLQSYKPLKVFLMFNNTEDILLTEFSNKNMFCEHWLFLMNELERLIILRSFQYHLTKSIFSCHHVHIYMFYSPPKPVDEYHSTDRKITKITSILIFYT